VHWPHQGISHPLHTHGAYHCLAQDGTNTMQQVHQPMHCAAKRLGRQTDGWTDNGLLLYAYHYSYECDQHNNTNKVFITRISCLSDQII